MMKKLSSQHLPFLTCLLLVGCGGGDSSGSDPVIEPPVIEPPSLENPQQNLKPLVDSWLTEKMSQLADINCTDEATENELCQRVTIKFSDGEFDASKADDKQTILILDTALEFPAVLRYRSRMKAALTQMDDGYYHQNDINGYDPSIEAPEVARDILQELDGFTDEENQSRFIPAKWLNSLYTVFQQVYPSSLYQQYLGHGNTPLLYLLEHNPEAEFVVGPVPDFFGKRTDLFCYPEQIEAGESQNNLQRLAALIVEVSVDFKQSMIDGLAIDYINFSAGHTLESVQESWQAHCAGSLPDSGIQAALLETLRPFYQVLFDSDNVFAFQATGVNMNVTNNPLDIESSFKNRLLVGDFTTLDSQLPLDGQLSNQQAPELLESRNNSKQWIDIFVNFGIKTIRPFPYNETPLMETDPLGLDSYPITSMQPSWAAPVALSRAIHIKNSVFPDAVLDNLVIEDIVDKMTPKTCDYSNWQFEEYDNKCKMQDPLLWRQHEVYRLEYLD
ncbi:hypothetical protein [Thalassomonas haliotis]|uniref:Lipoprotein n=1 Tax=Thalassomonas haliotis TaxID=485448 RepID=A0ABY7VA72_9GAMM|nr:hypothetical protein [Thalassomonas haliotis]WDE10549.1 hypothetical protein H3N35_20125 [Thalassomonas haliotis]